MSNATLMVHAGGTRVGRDILRTLPDSEPMGPRHKPIRHDVLVETLSDVLKDAKLSIKREEYALYADNAVLFGIMDLESANGLGEFSREGSGFALGIRAGNNQSMSLQLAVGQRVFVCDNMAFAGDLIALKRKHVHGVRLERELREAVTRYQEQTGRLVGIIDRAREVELSTDQAKGLIYDQFAASVLPSRKFGEVHQAYFHPEEEWTDITRFPNTLDSLHNAFTRVCRSLKPRARFEATTKLGRLLEWNLN